MSDGVMTYGKASIAYTLHLMERKTLSIAVHPDKSVVVKAPQSSTLEAIEESVRRRSRWIKKQISYFSQFDPRTPERQYVGGETHVYLGRRYRLKIECSNVDKVLLKGKYFWIESQRCDPSHIQKLIETWYYRKATEHLSTIFEGCWSDFNKRDYSKPLLKLRKMEKRWGSLSKKGLLTLNTRLIQTPRECIEYVVIHELCHLVHHNHSSAFYKLLDKTLPDWIARKHKLEMAQ